MPKPDFRRHYVVQQENWKLKVRELYTVIVKPVYVNLKQKQM
jgi:hypothetical protein